MKKYPVIYCILFAAASVGRAFGADAVSAGVASKITAVAVYGDRAVVTRTADLNLDPGVREITFERLPWNLVDQSLQVSGSGTAESAILDVKASQTFVDATPNERIKALEDDLAALAKQGRVLTDRLAIINDERDFVKRLLTSATTVVPVNAPGGSGSRPSLDEWQKIYDYSDTMLGKLATETQAIDAQREVLAARKAALDQQMAQLRGMAGGRSFKTVVVRVSASKPGTLRLDLAYSVPNASWTPSYDARVRSAERSVELGYFGVVRQNTGEDWDNVTLTLSTARPSLGGGAPFQPPWTVEVARPAAPAAIAASYSVVETYDRSRAQNFIASDNSGFAVSSVGAGGRLELNLADKAATFAEAGVSSGTTSATFKIATPVSLPSNNTTQRISITTLKLGSELRYESTPKMREAAFLAAPAVNTSSYPLLAGTLNTFLDNSYVATSTMAPAMPGEKFDLALGVDDGISIKRKLVNRFAEDTGLSSKGRRVTYEILVTVTNNKGTTEEVRFREPVPVSRDEKIVVKLLTPLERDLGTPDRIKEIVREIDGRLTWRLNLKPGEKREVTLKFSIEYPSDVVVSGVE